jgi:uncharacterized membrane protein YfcA
MEHTSPYTVALLAVLFMLAALLYSAVGHAGASGYLAAMGLVGVAAPIMKPTALVMNILVATIATVRFRRSGHFVWSLFWPFAVGSVPLAFVGGAIQLPGAFYKPLVGAVLLVSAVWLLKESHRPSEGGRHLPPLAGIACGALIGLLAGLTGTGGGIFLSPLLLFTGWATIRETSAVSAAFILANSVSGLAGNWTAVNGLPWALPLWMISAAIGGALGATLGSRWLATATLRRLLAAVLAIAALKLLLI